MAGIQETGEKQTAVYGVVLPSGKAHALRMPLDGQNGEKGMDGCFDHAVRGVLNDDKTSADPPETLMVCTVNSELFSVEASQNAAG